jgi:hypothetical protein
MVGCEKSKTIPVTGRGCVWGYEMSRIPHFPYDRLAASGEFVSLIRRPNLLHTKTIWYSFPLEAE